MHLRLMRAQAIFALLAVLLTSCALFKGVPNPVATAERPETVAFALYGSFVIVEEAAANLAENPAMPDMVRRALIAADEAAAPVAAQLRPAAEAVEQIREQLAEGESVEEKLAIAMAKLNDWINQIAPLLRNLSAAVTQAKEAL